MKSVNNSYVKTCVQCSYNHNSSAIYIFQTYRSLNIIVRNSRTLAGISWSSLSSFALSMGKQNKYENNAAEYIAVSIKMIYTLGRYVAQGFRHHTHCCS